MLLGRGVCQMGKFDQDPRENPEPVYVCMHVWRMKFNSGLSWAREQLDLRISMRSR